MRKRTGMSKATVWPRLQASMLVGLLLAAYFGDATQSRKWSSSGSNRRGNRPPQRFAIEPQSKVATIGEDVVLACRVENKVGTLQWTRDGFGLGIDRNLSGFSRYAMVGNDEEGDYTLHIRGVTLEDDADFQCQVGAMDGIKGIRSRFAHLNVRVAPEPPRIYPPGHMTTTAGMRVELVCRSDGGKPAADLTWFDGLGNRVEGPSLKREIKPVPDSKRENSLLTWTFHPSKEHDGQTLTCRADNPATTDSMLATITMEVRYPPAITFSVENDKVQEGDTVRFLCSAQANPTELTYRWFRNDEPIKMAGNENFLVLERVSRRMNGETVTCEVRNSIGISKSTQTLNVYYKPQFRNELPVVAAEIGTEVALTCEVDGNPRPDVVWLREGSTQVLAKQATFVIRDMEPADAGKYVCRASSSGYQEIHTEITVYVKGPPHISSPQLQYGMEGQEVHVECLIVSVPPAGKVQWEKNGQLLDIDNNQGIEMIKEPLTDGERNLLVIHHASDDDFGEYNCSAWNAFGEDSMLISVRRHRNVATFVVMLAATSGAVVIVLLSIMVIFCVRRKPSQFKGAADFNNDNKNGKALQNGPMALNGTTDHGPGSESDLKVELRATPTLAQLAHIGPHVNGDTAPAWDDDNAPALPPYNSACSGQVDGAYDHSTPTQQANGNKPAGTNPQNNNGTIVGSNGGCAVGVGSYQLSYGDSLGNNPGAGDFNLLVGGPALHGGMSPSPAGGSLVANGTLYNGGSNATNAALILPQYALNDLSGAVTSPSECGTLPRNGTLPLSLRIHAMAVSPHTSVGGTVPFRSKNTPSSGSPNSNDPISPQRYITATQNGHTVVGQGFKNGQLATHV
ncbi:irregular chiasm C-roughest protein-like isoform X2 [Varroa destructor]|uniref:Ig-like domain-containing protein n=1 Tax=Varroa destructor TaxID=109461 RepID=A0A7M7KVV1_VARDE|nr:irregular chiasm C-roughest protein-like isoform X2 [Varroa destructor]